MENTKPIMNGCTETDRRIQILLSTYNGANYLCAQLDSFLQQDCFEQCCVLIRDDGSTDSTRDILQKYANNSSFTIVFGDNIGVNKSYQWLIHHSDPTCDYYAFSDQDDVWLPHKLSNAMNALGHEQRDIPVLFATRTNIVDANLLPLGESPSPRRGISFYNAMVQNVLPGHTQVFNKSLRDILTVHGFEDAYVVDWWLYLTATAVGHVIFSEDAQVLHRQHGNNSVGYRLTFFSQFCQRIKAIKQKKGNAISCQLAAFLRSWQEELSPECSTELISYLNSLPRLSTRISYLFRCQVYRQKRIEDLAFRLFYLVGKYNI